MRLFLSTVLCLVGPYVAVYAESNGPDRYICADNGRVGFCLGINIKDFATYDCGPLGCAPESYDYSKPDDWWSHHWTVSNGHSVWTHTEVSR